MVDVLIHYPANSVVDLGQVTSKLVSSNGTGGSLNPGGGNATTMVGKFEFKRDVLQSIYLFNKICRSFLSNEILPSSEALLPYAP